MRDLSNIRKIYAWGSLLLGVLLLFWPGSALRMAAYAAGIVVMAGGLTSILAWFRRKNRYRAIGGANLVVGIIVIFVGGWIFTNPENFAAIIPTAIGYLIVLSGIVNLLETFSLSRAHYRNWWASLLAALLTIFMGVLLVNHAFGVAAVMVRLVGVFLLFNGISDLWINRRVDRYVRRRRGPGQKPGPDGSARFDTSDPDIIDADDYREL